MFSRIKIIAASKKSPIGGIGRKFFFIYFSKNKIGVYEKSFCAIYSYRYLFTIARTKCGHW
jgi:hypothetical protein